MISIHIHIHTAATPKPVDAATLAALEDLEGCARLGMEPPTQAGHMAMLATVRAALGLPPAPGIDRSNDD